MDFVSTKYRLGILMLTVALYSVASSADQNLHFAEACASGDNIEILAVGDILLHSPLQRQAMIHPDRYQSLWKDMLPYIQKADIAYANLEGAVARNVTKGGTVLRTDAGHRFDNNVYSSYPLFNYHPYLVEDIKASGFDIVSTSNNHSLDRRSIGVDKTIEELLAVNLPYVGTRTQAEAADPNFSWHRITRVKGRNIAWVACTFSTNGVPDPHRQVMPCFQNQSELLGLITRLSTDPQIHAVIVTPHWGNEYQLTQHSSQTQLGRAMIGAGATAVLATHPHVVQPWEKVTVNGREGLIVYSTGNFVSNQPQVPRRTSAMIQLHLTGPANAKLKIRGAAYLPIYMQRAPTLNVAPVYNMSSVPTEAARIWSNAYGTANRINSLEENQIEKFCSNLTR